MNATVRICFTILALLPRLWSSASDDPRISLDTATRAKCLSVLRGGLHGDEFWPSMHAAEGLTLGGQGLEVVEYLTPQLTTETDDQHLCGIAREIVRAGDRSAVQIMLNILAGENNYGHVHAAESLFKVFDIGDGQSMQRAYAQSDNLKLKLMAAGALVHGGVGQPLQTVRDLLKDGDPSNYTIAAWVLGQIGDRSDIPRLQAQLSRCPDPATRANFEHALAILGDPDGQQALQQNLTSQDNAIRTYAATFAGDARVITARARLTIMLDDSHPDARIRAAQSLLMLASPKVLRFEARSGAVFKELNAKSCWFHPRVAALPALGKDGRPAVVMTIQKHLGVSDHYSGLYYLRTNDLGETWTGPTEIPELASQLGENNETIAVCDVTPGWLTHSGKLLAIGVKLRYSPEGEQLVDKARSHECAYATYDPTLDKWSAWKLLEMPDTDGKFFLVAPGCVQWLEQSDGTLLIPVYIQGPHGSDYTATVLHCSYDGLKLKYITHGDELTTPGGRGYYEPSLTRFHETYYLTLRHDTAAFVTTSDDGLHFAPVKKWTFDDEQDLGSYNTQTHWLTHGEGLFLSYTRRGADNDHIMRNRAPIFIAQVDPQTLQVLRRTEQILLPERGVMLGNFGTASISPHESWVTDAEFLVSDKPHPKGADGTVWLGRVKWSRPNQSVE